AAGCSGARGEADRILLVTVDTLRWDRLGYAGHDVETPNLDALAASGAVFTGAVSAAPLTLPSHATILSGLYPTSHQTRNNGTFRVPEGVETVAETLKQAGYGTGAFVGAFVLDSRFGLEQGFDHYDDELPEENAVHKAYYPERRAEEVVSRALAWVRAHEDEKLFLWVHVFDPHAPHNPPSPFAERYGERVYDAEIAYTDHALGPLFGEIQSGERGKNAAVLVTADHGESLGEHGESTHALFVYDATMRVPLIVKAPGVAPGSRVETQVRTVDIAPAILELAGVERKDSLDGVSLLGYLRGEEAPRTAYGESFVPRLNFNWSELRFLRTDRYKLIDAPRRELYDLETDPGEETNLWKDPPPAEARDLLRELESLKASEATGIASTIALDEETARRLESLGYIAGAPPRREGAELPDPKDRVEVYERLQDLLGREDLTAEEAIAEYRDILALEPENALARNRLANTLAEERRYEEAVGEFRALMRVSEVDSQGVENLGVALLLLDEVEEALAVTEAAVQETPWDPDLQVLRGEALERAGRPREALGAYERALEIQPEDAENYWRRGAVLLKVGEDARAEEDFRKAIDADPDLEPARIALSRRLSQTGRVEEARKLLEEASKGGETSPEWKAGLAEAEIAAGNLEKARALLEEARAEDPDNARVLALLGPLYGRGGELEKAAATLQRAISLGETAAELRRNLALVYLRQGKLEGAIRELLAASETAPGDARVWFSLGNAYLRARRPSSAAEALEKSLALEPGGEEALFNLALAYDQVGNRSLAAEAYRRFLATGVEDETRRREAERRLAAISP
ncbi:MAG: sulfatase-like hydrolase/transferase, partial [Vicinamibacteria bacterium]